MGYRVIRLDLAAMNLMIQTGALCAKPENIPPDLRIVDARTAAAHGRGALELLCCSGTWKPDPDHPTRAVVCGGASDSDWLAPEFVIEATYAGRMASPCVR